MGQDLQQLAQHPLPKVPLPIVPLIASDQGSRDEHGLKLDPHVLVVTVSIPSSLPDSCHPQKWDGMSRVLVSVTISTGEKLWEPSFMEYDRWIR
jgi:hypothetical protein